MHDVMKRIPNRFLVSMVLAGLLSLLIALVLVSVLVLPGVCGT
jgi:hypothetical protein